MGAQQHAPHYLDPTEYAAHYAVGLDEFFSIAALAPSILPEIVSVAGRLRILDREPIGAPALADAQPISPDDDPDNYVPAAEFCAMYGVDHEALLRLAFGGKLPDPYRAADGKTALLHRGDVRLWELGRRADIAGG